MARKTGKQGKAMKYMIKADIKVNGTVQRKDIIGAIMGQTEGLLGDDLELRKLQRTARVGHVDVEMETKGVVHIKANSRVSLFSLFSKALYSRVQGLI